jgi:hypothetical protein
MQYTKPRVEQQRILAQMASKLSRECEEKDPV